MARDVEFNVTASDRTGSALAAAERNFDKTRRKIDEGSKKAGEGLGKGLGDGIGKAAPKMLGNLNQIFGKAGLTGGPAIAAGLAAAAPFIGGVISGAIIGGVGIGGVIGGVAIASRDGRVKAAGKALGENLGAGLDQAGAAFIEPTLDAIAKIEDRFEVMKPRLMSIFANSAGFLDPLLDGALDGIDGILEGVDKLVRRARPVIDSFGSGFAQLGDAVGEALDIISGDSGNAATALDALFAIAAGGIKTVAYLVRGLTELWGVISYIPGKIMDLQRWLGILDEKQSEVAGSGEFAAASAKVVTAALGAQGPAAQTTGEAMATLAERINGVYNANRNIYDSQTAVGAAFDNLTKSVRENGKSLSANTEKGRANRQALSGLVSALNSNYQAFVDVNGEGRKANGVLTSNYNSFVKAATGILGSKRAAEEYARKLGLIPPKKTTSFTANTHDAEARIKALQQKINSTKGKTVNFTVNVGVKNKAALGKLGPQVGANFKASDHWAAMDTSTGATSRTGGPTPVSVTNDIAVSLDGAPFRAMTVRAVQARSDRDAWRQKVGRI